MSFTIKIEFLLRKKKHFAMLSVSPSNGGRSSLEEMLESIKRRDEQPKDIPPALPTRPLSKARLPSARRSLPVNFKIGDDDINNNSNSDRVVISTGDDLGFGGVNKVAKVKVVPVVELPVIGELGEERKEEVVDLCVVDLAVEKGVEVVTEGDMKSGNVEYALTKGFRVWCHLSSGEWKDGKIESAFTEDALVMLADDNVVIVPRENILPANPYILEAVGDLTRLGFLNEPSVLHNLQTRYLVDKFYTKAGNVLVAINPFKDGEFQQKELFTQRKFMDPHVHTTADTAFDEMMRDEESQCIILTGETGAGKTETANSAARCLAALGGSDEIEFKILQANYILEAFGNAKTYKNHNSSRFGKVMEMDFNAAGKICGAKIETYLFEKSRVVRPVKGERSYHIFYQLCRGAPSTMKERLNLKKPMEYEFLNQSGCLTIDGVDDAQRFHMLLEALDHVQVSKEDQENVFAMLSAVMWLGNISFQTMDNENHVEVIVDEAMACASNLMGCNIEDLILTLSTHCIQVGGSDIVQKLTLQQAIDTRDALAEHIYASLFDWLLQKINRSLEIDKQKAWKSITIVDICGFESSQKNNFEQLHINYVNEKLHQHFNRHLFKLEQEEYTREGIDWTQVDLKDNQECINLFEEKPSGLLSLVDEESNSAESTDVTLFNKLQVHLSSKPCFKEKKDGTFSVCHYAGEVLYDTSGFLKETRNSLHLDFAELLSSCTYQLPQLFASNMFKSSHNLSYPSHKGPQSVEMKFEDQLLKLMQRMENVKPHFICCIRPNDKQIPHLFEKDLVLQQLRSCGILEILRISRLGYTTRMTHQQFLKRYEILKPSNMLSQEPLNTSIAILQRFNIHPDAYQIGYTKFFLRTWQVDMLEHARKRMLQCIVKVQKCFRGHLARCQFLELTKRITTQQSFDQAENVRIDSQHLTKRSGTVPPIEEVLKQHIDMEAYQEQQRAIIILQSVVRGWLVRKNSHRIHKDLKQEYTQVPASVVAELQTALKQKEDENAALQTRLKQFQIRWVENDARMKTMEETWQKQMASLQANLAAAKISAAVNESQGQNGRSNAVAFSNYCDSSDTMSAPRTPEHRTPRRLAHQNSDATTPGRDANGSLNAVGQLAKELEQRKQVFNNDVKILVEVKTGQSASTYSYDDLRKVKKNFEAWKKEFKEKLQETKKLVKRGNQESENNCSRSWWGKKSTKKT